MTNSSKATSLEILACDAEIMAQRLATAGVPCTLQLWEKQLHVFQMFGELLPESRNATAETGSFISKALTSVRQVSDAA
jgi:acetyl esterase/lipase